MSRRTRLEQEWSHDARSSSCAIRCLSIGIVLRADSPERIEELLDQYEEIIGRAYLATMPEVAPIQ